MSSQVFNPVRIGVIGVGNFGRLHALTLAGLSEAQLVGVVDTNPQQLDALRDELPDVTTWHNLDDALNDADADAWVIATRTETHIDIAEKILHSDENIALLIEKPLAENLMTARHIESLVAQNPNRVMLGHILLYATEIRQILREIERRGSLTYLHSVRHRPIATWDVYQESPFRLLMIHDLYVTYALVNGEEPTRIVGRVHQRDDGGYDLALADLEWASGTWATLTASYLTPPGMSAEGYDRLEVFGRGWAAQIHPVPHPLQVWAERAEWPLPLNVDANPVAPSGWLAEELRHFCRVVRGTGEPPLGASYADALRIQGWLEQLEQSALRSDE